MALGFFVIAVVLFPFGVGPEAKVLARIAAGIVWVTALLAALLSLDRLFQADYEDGTLDLLIMAPPPAISIVAAKCLAHWLTTGLPIIIMAPLLALMLDAGFSRFGVLVLSLALGTPLLTLIGAVGAALTLGARRGGVLLSLLVLPLYIPVLILGILALDADAAGQSARAPLLWLGALLLATSVFAPVATAAALRQAAE